MAEAPAAARDLVSEVLEAYGLEQWRGADRLMVIFSLGGLALASRLRGRSVRCRTAFVSTAGEPRVLFDPYPRVGSKGTVEAHRVSVSGSGGREIAARQPARPATRWDDLDVLAFAGASLWTWVALPLALGGERVSVHQLPPEDDRRLEVILPGDRPATSSHHVLSVDGDGRIVRHEEYLTILGRRVPVAHELSGHCEFGGVLVATRRRTTYARRGELPQRLAAPVLWADVIAATLVPRFARNSSTDSAAVPKSSGSGGEEG